MSVHHARIIGLAAVLVGITALGPSTSVRAQQPVSDLPLDLRARAEQGDAAAQFTLGVMYADGEGVPQDYVEAHMFNLAAAQSSGEDRERRVAARDGIAEYMTADQIAEAQRRTREWTPTPEP